MPRRKRERARPAVLHHLTYTRSKTDYTADPWEQVSQTEHIAYSVTIEPKGLEQLAIRAAANRTGRSRLGPILVVVDNAIKDPPIRTKVGPKRAEAIS